MIDVVLAMFVFLSMTSILGTFLHMINMKGIPKIVCDVYSYGKSCEEKLFSTFVKAVLVPKSWFFHFYIFATVYTFTILMVIVWIVFLKNELPVFIHMYISSLSANSHTALASPQISLLAVTLFLLQVSRRAYESMYVTVFSDSKMNIGHYVVGYLHYWGCGTVLLSYSVSHSMQNNHVNVQTRNGIHLQHVIGTILFIYASYQQYIAHVTLANLRKNPQNKQKHSLPQGGLFSYVSCPNFLCEILIYIAIYLVLGVGHYPWGLITFWVFTNQIMSATMGQNWYKSKFKDFPATRKALIPFVY